MSKDLNDLSPTFIYLASICHFQGLLDKTTLFNFGCRMARYRIPEHEHRKCLVSFYSYARQIASIREKIALTFKKEEFDHEVSFNISFPLFIYV